MDKSGKIGLLFVILMFLTIIFPILISAGLFDFFGGSEEIPESVSSQYGSNWKDTKLSDGTHNLIVYQEQVFLDKLINLTDSGDDLLLSYGKNQIKIKLKYKITGLQKSVIDSKNLGYSKNITYSNEGYEFSWKLTNKDNFAVDSFYIELENLTNTKITSDGLNFYLPEGIIIKLDDLVKSGYILNKVSDKEVSISENKLIKDDFNSKEIILDPTISKNFTLKDTMLYQGATQQNHNFGTTHPITIDGDSGTERRALFYFNYGSLINNATINYAWLTLDGGSGTSGRPVLAYALTTDWDEGTGDGTSTGDGATWLNATGSVLWDTQGGDYNSTLLGYGSWSSSYFQINVTKAINWFNQGLLTNKGFLVITNQTTALTISTKEATGTSVDPYLNISWSYPSPNFTLLPQNTSQTSRTVTFNCTASMLGIDSNANITKMGFYYSNNSNYDTENAVDIYNQLFNSTSVPISNITNSINWTTTIASDNIYYFWCYADVSFEDSTTQTLFPSEERKITIDSTPPVVNITYPLNGSFINYNSSISLNYSISDFSTLTNCWYSLDWGANISLPSCQNNTFNASVINHLIILYANDSLGNRGNSTTNFTIDKTFPLVSFGTNTQNTGTNLSVNYTYVNVTFTETNFQNITFLLTNATAIVNRTTFTTATYFINWTNLPSARYYYNVSVVDKANNRNTTETYILTLDYLKPNATLKSPSNNSFSNVTSQNYSAYLNDSLSGIKNATLYIYNSSNYNVNSTSFTFTGQVSYIIGTIVTLIDDVYNWFYTVFDFSGNSYTTQNNTMIIDTTLPVIQFNAPTPNNNTNQSNLTVVFNVTGTEPNLNSSWVSINNVNYTMTCSFTSSFTCNYTKVLSDGLYNFTAYANDTAGNVKQAESRRFRIDTTPPTSTASGTSPPDGATYTFNTWTNDSVSFTITATDGLGVGVASNFPKYCVDTTNTCFPTTSIGLGTTVSTVGVSYVRYQSNDTLNNNESVKSQTIKIDTVKPAISITYPLNNSNTTNTQLGLNYTVSDTYSGVNSCWYSRNNGATNSSLSSCINISGVTWYEGLNNLTVYVNDTMNNINSSSVTFRLDTTPPTVTIVAPSDNGIYRDFYNYTINLNVSASDSGVSKISGYKYSLNGATNVTFTPNTTITGIAGKNNLTVYVNDTLNNIGNSTISFNLTFTPKINSINISNSSTSYSRDGFNTGLIMFYNFDMNRTDKAVDSMGNSNGTVGSEVLFTKNGLVGGAYIFNRSAGSSTTNNYVAIPDSSGLTNFSKYDNYSVSLWFNTLNKAEQSITEHWNGGGGYPWVIRGPASSTGVVSVATYNGSSGGSDGCGGTTNLADNTWHMVTFVMDGLNVSMWTDGAITCSDVVGSSGNLFAGSNGFNIGARSSSGTYGFNGSIDEFRVYNRSLSSSEIQQMYYMIRPTFQEYPNVTINATITDEDTPQASLTYSWFVDGVEKLSGLAQSVFNYIFNGRNQQVTLNVNDSNNYNVSQTWNISTNYITPTINFTFPTPSNNSFQQSQSFVVNFTTNDTNFQSGWVQLDFTNYSASCTSGVPAYCNYSFSSVSEGQHNITAYVNDTVGNTNQTEKRRITIDLTKPLPNITYPANFSYNYVVSHLNYSFTETNSNQCWYSVNGGTTNTSITCGNNVTGLTANQGTNTWLIIMNDSAGNTNYTSVIFTVDSVLPSVTIAYPINNSNFSVTSIGVNYTTSDLNLQSCKWTKDGGLTNTSITCGTNITSTFSEGLNNVTVYANDTLNNEGSSSVTFRVDTTKPLVTIYYPTDNLVIRDLYTYNVTLNTSASDLGIGTISSYWFSLNGGANTSFTPNASFIGIAGKNNLTVYANDTLNNWNSTSISFNLSFTPNITSWRISNSSTVFSNLTNNTFQEYANVTINATVTDYDTPQSSLYYDWFVDGVRVLSGLAQKILNYLFSPQSRIVTLFVNDTYQYNTSQYWNISTTYINPGINFTNPTETNGSYLNKRSILVNVSVTDANLKNITIFISNSSYSIINRTTTNSTPNYQNISVNYDGVFYINATTYDIVGNYNTTEIRKVTVDTTNPGINYSDNSEIDGANVSRDTILINTTINELNIENISFTLYNSSFNTDGLVGYWNFDRNLTNPADLSSNGGNGVVSGAVWNSTSKLGGGYDFDGINDVIKSSKKLSLNETNFTVSLWYRAKTNISAANLVNYAYAIYSGFQLRHGAANPNTIIWCGGNSSITDCYLLVASTQNLLNWNFYTVSYNIHTGFTMAYVNGVNTFNATRIGLNISTITNNLSIGSAYSSNFVNGSIDEVMVFNRTLSTREVISIYQRGIVNHTTYTTQQYENFTNLSDGDYHYYADVLDKVGLYNFTNIRNIRIDTHNPNGTLLSPTNGTYNQTTTQNFTANLTDNLGLANYSLNIYNSSGSQINLTTVLETVSNTLEKIIGIVVSLPDDIYTFFYSIWDWAGNSFTTLNNTVTIDSTKPSLTIYEPTSSSYNYNTSLQLNFSVSDINLEECWYNLDNTANLSLTNCQNTTFNTSEGSHILHLYANDTARNLANVSVSFSVNLAPPSVVIHYPLDGNYLNYQNNIYFNYTPTDSDGIGTCEFWINSTGTFSKNQSNSTITSGNLNFFILSLTEGNYLWNVWCNDTGGNGVWGNPTINNTFTIDTTFPLINLTSPTEESFVNKSQNYIIINSSWTETHFSNITFYANTSSYTYTSQVTNHTFILPDGNYTYNVTLCDLSNNCNTTLTRSIVLDTTKPTINFTSPTETNNTYFSRTNALINVSSTDRYLKNITTFLFNESYYLVNTTTTTTSPNYINVSNLPEGVYYINATSFDHSGNSNSTETRKFIIDISNPLINYSTNSEINNNNVSRSNIFVNTTLVETNFQNITFVLWNLTGEVDRITYSTQISYINWTGLPDTDYSYNVTLTDKVNLRNTTLTRTIRLDTTQPSASLDTPQNGTYANVSSNNFTVQLSDNLGVKNTTLNIWNGSVEVNRTTTSFDSGVISISFGTIVSLLDGIYQFFYSAFDWAGNKFTTTNNTVTIDTIRPLIEFTSITPVNGTNTTDTSLLVEVNVTDTNIDTIKFILYNSTAQVNLTEFKDGTETITYLSLPDDFYYFNVSVNDSAGYFNFTKTRTITLDDTPPIVTIFQPTHRNYAYNNSLELNFSVSDNLLGVKRCVYYVYNSSYDLVIPQKTITNCQNTTFSVPSGDIDYDLYVTSSDYLDNIQTPYSATINFGVRMVKPAVVLDNPLQSRNFSSQNNIRFNFTATDSDGIDTCKLYGNWTGTWEVNQTSNSVSSGLQKNFNLLNLSEGTFKWNVWCNDTYNNQDFALSNQTLTIDLTYPVINITSPINGSTESSSSITTAYSLTEEHPAICRWSKTGGISNTTLTCGSSFTDTFSSGENTVTIYAIDSAGNENSSRVTFIVSTTAPGGGGGQQGESTIPVIGLIDVNGTKTYKPLEREVIYSNINDFCSKKITQNEFAVADYSIDCQLTKEEVEEIRKNIERLGFSINSDDMLLFYKKYKETSLFQGFETQQVIEKYNLFASVLGITTPLKITPPSVDTFYFLNVLGGKNHTIVYKLQSNKNLKSCSVTSNTKNLICSVQNTTITINYLLENTNFFSRVFSGTISVLTDAKTDSVEQKTVSIAFRVYNLGGKNVLLVGLGVILLSTFGIFLYVRKKKLKLKDVKKLLPG